MGGLPLEKKLKERFEQPIKDVLNHYHHNELMTVRDMAEFFGCSRETVRKLMDRFGVNRRPQSELMKVWWEKATPEQREVALSTAHEKTRELAGTGDLSFQKAWREKPEEMRKQAAQNAIKTCRIRKRNGMTGMTGSKHHLWNPERTHEQRVKARQTEEHKEWLRAVYERDGYTCQHCGYDKGGNLNAHHLNSFADNKKMRYEIPNGITLCKPCHVNFHNRYGYGKNTAEQFNEYHKKG